MPLSVKSYVRASSDDKTARETQELLAQAVRLDIGFKQVAGVTLVYSKDEREAYVAASVLSINNWSVVHEQRLILEAPPRRPPDLVGFREGPLMLEVLTRLAVVPDVLFVDGTGIAHPRKFGVACHVGLSLDLPTVGVTDLWPLGCRGTHAVLGKSTRGRKTALLLETVNEPVGWELVTQAGEKPVYVSPGHRVGQERAAEMTLKASPWFRLPQCLRTARETALEMAKAADR